MKRFFWFSKQHLAGEKIINFGDDINPLLIEKITGKSVVWTNPATQNWYERNFTRINFAIGSILHFATDNCNIWGSGLIDSKINFPKKAKYYAVRGPETYQILKEAGCKVNQVYGDPALLLPKYLAGNNSKKFKLGIIPHYVEVDDFKKQFKETSDEIKIIDLKDDVLKVLDEITSCENILSSSLHGLIVGMAYGIPSLRMKLTDQIYGDGIKYEDYYKSVGIDKHEILHVDPNAFNFLEVVKLFEKKENMLINTDLGKIQDQLLEVKPF